MIIAESDNHSFGLHKAMCVLVVRGFAVVESDSEDFKGVMK